jgi:hypothetical protein
VDGPVISWIVASHDEGILDGNLLATLPVDTPRSPRWSDSSADPSVEVLSAGADEVVIVRDMPSIARAYNVGQRVARGSVYCYVHHDVRVLDLRGLRLALLATVRRDLGMVGVIGSRVGVVPWWDAGAGQLVGSVLDTRLGRLDFGGCGQVAFLDGLLLATAHDDLVWDETIPGWHLYDHDQCQQQIAAARPNYVIGGGADLLEHRTGNPTSTGRLPGWAEAEAVFRAKWPAR